jgi:BASS family bile acid:Na+ symporter
METGILVNVILPASLFFIMFGMGMSLVTDDFKRIVKQPKAALVGFSAQMVLLPLLALTVISIFEMDPLLAVGLMILSFCPGGTTSNMMTFLVKGDVALSISLTAIVSLVAPFTIPLLTNLSMDYILGEASEFVLPLQQTVLTLVAITALPVGLGMILRKYQANFCDRMENTVKFLSLFFLFLIVAGIIKNNQENIVSYFQQVGLPVLTLNILAMLLGLGVALLLKLNREQSVTISYEVGMQNGTTAMLVTSTILHNDVMTIAPAIYSLVMFIVGGIFGAVLSFVFNKRSLVI